MVHSTLLEKLKDPIEMSDVFSYAAIFASLAGLFISALISTFASDVYSALISAFASDVYSRIVDHLKSFPKLGFKTNKSLMLYARDLRIKDSNKREYWEWVGQRDQTTFTEAAELLKTFTLEITAQTKFDKLLAETNYTAHLIFKAMSSSKGLDTFQGASVSVGSLQWKKVVCIKPRLARSRNGSVGLPVKRSDGWMELELGSFYCDDRTGDQEVVVSLTETDGDNLKSGLLVAAIELRPIYTA